MSGREIYSNSRVQRIFRHYEGIRLGDFNDDTCICVSIRDICTIFLSLIFSRFYWRESLWKNRVETICVHLVRIRKYHTNIVFLKRIIQQEFNKIEK